jgi:hypothetical protein
MVESPEWIYSTGGIPGSAPGFLKDQATRLLIGSGTVPLICCLMQPSREDTSPLLCGDRGHGDIHIGEPPAEIYPPLYVTILLKLLFLLLKKELRPCIDYQTLE